MVWLPREWIACGTKDNNRGIYKGLKVYKAIVLCAIHVVLSIRLTTFQVSPDHSSINLFIKDSDFEKDQKEVYRSKPQLSNSLLVDEIGIIIMIIL